MNKLKQALFKTQQFNQIIKQNTFLYKRFVLGRYNFLQAFQSLIFIDFKKFLENQSFLERSKNKKKNLLILTKEILLKIFCLIFSFVSACCLLKAKRRILIYSSDNTKNPYKGDFRLEAIYKFLIKNKLSFFEIFHTQLKKQFLLNIIKRKRKAFYLESIDFIYDVYKIFNSFKPEINKEITTLKKKIDQIEVKNINKKEIAFIKYLLLKYLLLIYKFEFKINVLGKMIRLIRPKYVLSLDDPRYYNELIIACQENNVKFYAFQHGHFTKYHVGWLDCGIFNPKNNNIIKPNKLFVQGEYWKSQLLRLGTYFNGEEIEVYSQSGGSIIGSKSNRDKNNRGQKNILILYETDAPKIEVLNYIKDIIKCPDLKVFFKIRPDKNKEEQIEEYKIKKLVQFNKILLCDNLRKIQGGIDLTIGTYSTLLYEMIRHNIPVAIIKTSIDYGEDMLINKLADAIDITNGNVCSQIRKIIKTPWYILNRRKILLLGNKSYKQLDYFLHQIEIQANTS